MNFVILNCCKECAKFEHSGINGTEKYKGVT